MSIVIDKQSGALVFAGEAIPSGISENAFAESALGKRAMRTPSTDGWVIYSKIKVASAGLILRFLDGMLAEVNLAFLDTSNGWANWSEEKESSAKFAQDRWLESQLGAPPYAFKWGNVESLQDAKAGGSLILIRYHKH